MIKQFIEQALQVRITHIASLCLTDRVKNGVTSTDVTLSGFCSINLDEQLLVDRFRFLASNIQIFYELLICIALLQAIHNSRINPARTYQKHNAEQKHQRGHIRL